MAKSEASSRSTTSPSRKVVTPPCSASRRLRRISRVTLARPTVRPRCQVRRRRQGQDVRLRGSQPQSAWPDGCTLMVFKKDLTPFAKGVCDQA